MSGRTGEPHEGAARVLIRPKLLSDPMNGPPSREKAREKPQNILRNCQSVTQPSGFQSSPLECDNSHDSHRLENHGKSRFPSRHASIEKTDARDNQEHEHAHDHLKDIFEFNADVGCIDIDLLRIASLLVVRVPFRQVTRP
jgi:hypothetical protein